MLQEIGLFDEDFFAYYEDIDLAFRAQLNGWKVTYVPMAIAYHQLAVLVAKSRGLLPIKRLKNLPWLLLKNVARSVTTNSFTSLYYCICVLSWPVQCNGDKVGGHLRVCWCHWYYCPRKVWNVTRSKITVGINSIYPYYLNPRPATKRDQTACTTESLATINGENSMTIAIDARESGTSTGSLYR